MKLSDQILRKPLYVAFGQALSSDGITSIDLVATRDATTVTVTASDGSAAPIAGADASTAGVMTATDKVKLDGLSDGTTQDFAARLDVAAAVIAAGTTHLRTAGQSAAGDGGDALYKRVTLAPSHALKVQSADGAWWEIVPTNNNIPFQACGGIAGDNAANGATNVIAFNDFTGYAQANGTATIANAPTLFFPEGHYHFNTHLNLKASIHMLGVGNLTRTGIRSSILEFPAESYGLIAHSQITIDLTTEAAGFEATGATIEKLYIKGGGNTGAVGSGIWMRTGITIRNCYITDFAENGVNIVAAAGAGGALEGNANVWYMERVFAENCGANGVFCDSADSNAGTAISCDFRNNGRWGVFDSSFLGNTWIGIHTSTNGVANIGGNPSGNSSHVEQGGKRYSAAAAATEAQLVATTPGMDETIWITTATAGSTSNIPTWLASQSAGTYFHGGPYHTDNVNARSLFLGCYREGDQGGNQIKAPSQVFGGLMDTNFDTGVSLHGSTWKGKQTYQNNNIYADPTNRDLNLNINPSNALVLQATASGDHPTGLSLLAWEEANKHYLIGQHAGLASRVPVRITSDLNTLAFGRASAVAGGAIIFGGGMFLGDGSSLNNVRHMAVGAAAPSSGEHARGDIQWNMFAAAGAALGWVCVTGGTPGTWVEIRGVANQTTGANQAALTNSSGGTRDGTLAAVGDTSTVNEGAKINDNFTELHTLLDEVRTTLVNSGLMKGGV